MAPIYHALMLNMHQPAGNLENLLTYNDWEAKEILWAYDRIPRSLWDWEDVARVHLTFTGTLLESLSDPDFQSRVYGISKLGDMLWYFQNQRIFDIIGTGYYHPVFPLIPEADWAEHAGRWLGIARHLFWRVSFQGFWPPEMGFCMEMIPMLKRMGYRYVMVDSANVEPLTQMDWPELRYRPHIAKHGGEEIIVVVRDRELSDAQEAGMDPGWFIHECHERTKFCDFPPLILTATDGDNGGWFRNTSVKGNFWNYFYQPLCERVRYGDTQVKPTFINQYLDQHGAHGEVKVRSAAWNTGWHNGEGFVQWTGSQAQKDALARVGHLSERVHQLKERAEEANWPHDLEGAYNEAQWRTLRAETSCNFYWGEAWVDRAHADLDQAEAALHGVGA